MSDAKLEMKTPTTTSSLSIVMDRLKKKRLYQVQEVRRRRLANITIVIIAAVITVASVIATLALSTWLLTNLALVATAPLLRTPDANVVVDSVFIASTNASEASDAQVATDAPTAMMLLTPDDPAVVTAELTK